MRHTLPLTVGACPVSGNPLSGRVSVSYASAGPVLEVVALLALLRDVERTAGAVEPIASELATRCSRALGVPVAVSLRVDVMPGPQTLEVTCAAVPR
jgi:NADPH-dependent 7-cyano-7-deazaguanine reductase QueF